MILPRQASAWRSLREWMRRTRSSGTSARRRGTTTRRTSSSKQCSGTHQPRSWVASQAHTCGFLTMESQASRRRGSSRGSATAWAWTRTVSMMRTCRRTMDNGHLTTAVRHLKIAFVVEHLNPRRTISVRGADTGWDWTTMCRGLAFPETHKSRKLRAASRGIRARRTNTCGSSTSCRCICSATRLCSSKTGCCDSNSNSSFTHSRCSSICISCSKCRRMCRPSRNVARSRMTMASCGELHSSSAGCASRTPSRILFAFCVCMWPDELLLRARGGSPLTYRCHHPHGNDYL
mmetsp:Transcript_62834/g.205126  ORF Transcript_62834/g.205126 Transcript_62834/m.205126 type:complete len:291 (-) Transcript_62834:596-1468(-)